MQIQIQNYQFNSDPDPVLHQSEANLPPTGLQALHATKVLHGSIKGASKLLNFDFNADTDPDPAFLSNADPDQASKKMGIHADPDPQP